MDSNTITPIADNASGVNFGDVWAQIEYLHPSNQRFQLRAIGSDGVRVGGPYTTADRAAVERWVTAQAARGVNIYIGLNPTDTPPGTTQNNERTTRRTALVVDVDADHPEGRPANDEERADVTLLTDKVKSYLCEEGWPEPLYMSSGNGAYLLYRIDLPTASEDVKALLVVLAARFNTGGGAHIDPRVHDAARIIRLAGTMNLKGIEAGPRKHHRAEITSLPKHPETVNREAWDAVLSGAQTAVPSQVRQGTGLYALDSPQLATAVERFSEWLDTQPEAAHGGRYAVVSTWIMRAKEGGIPAIVAADTIKASGKDGGWLEGDPTAGAVIAAIYRSARYTAGLNTPEAAFEINDDAETEAKRQADAESERKSALRARLKLRPDIEYSKTPDPEREWLIPDYWPLDRGDVQIWSGNGGSGKSALACQIALCAACNIPLLGYHLAHKSNGSRLKGAYVTAEDKGSTVKRRANEQRRKAASWSQTFDRGGPVVEMGTPDSGKVDMEGFYLSLALDSQDARLFPRRSDRRAAPEYTLSEAAKMLAEGLREAAVDVVFLDNASALYEGNENDRADVRAFLRAVERFASRANVLVVLLAHTNKIGGYSGSTDWNNGGTGRLLTTAKQNGENTVYCTETQKFNDAPVHWKVFYEWGGGYFFRTIPADEYTNARNAVTVEQQNALRGRILDVLDNNEAMTEGQIKERIPVDVAGKVRAEIRAMKSAGLIEAIPLNHRKTGYRARE